MIGWIRTAALAVIAVLALAAVVDARPGGGHSSSGGGRSSSSSRSSSGGGYRSGGGGGGSIGGAGAASLLVVIVIIVIIAAAASAAKKASTDWSSGAISYTEPPRPPPDLSPLQVRDPDLSQAVLEDFVFQLFSTAHRGRDNADALAALAPYLSDDAIAHLAVRGKAPSQIVIGTLSILDFQPATQADANDRIRVRVEATLHSASPTYVVEIWSLVRAATATSKPPSTTYSWPCPNCGAPWQGKGDRICQHCGETMQTGKFDWTVAGIQVMSQKPALASLTGTVEEYGNDLPTVFRADAALKMQAVTADDPQVTFEAVRARVALVYARLNEGWNASNLAPVRGLTTTPLRDYLQYWLDEYRRQGLQNRLDNAKIEYIELSKIIRDRHFDAITMRVRAGGNDFTVNQSGKVVGGSQTFFRRYTEYWTFLRSSSRRGPVNNTPSCPSCGAALSISDAGQCTFCDAMVENGSFDWILSKIEQDDTYTG